MLTKKSTIIDFIGCKSIKKKPAKTPPLKNSEAHTPEARAGQASGNSVIDTALNVNHSQCVSYDGLTNQRTVNGLVFIIDICYTTHKPEFGSPERCRAP